jgi:hypothetical protein
VPESTALPTNTQPVFRHIDELSGMVNPERFESYHRELLRSVALPEKFVRATILNEIMNDDEFRRAIQSMERIE